MRKKTVNTDRQLRRDYTNVEISRWKLKNLQCLKGKDKLNK